MGLWMATETKLRGHVSEPPIPVLDGFCPMPDIAQLIGGKWKLIILQILSKLAQILVGQRLKRFFGSY